MLDDLRTLPLIRYPHTPLIGLAFSFRKNASIDDGLYLALAQALGMPLLTRDAALETVAGVTVPVRVL